MDVTCRLSEDSASFFSSWYPPSLQCSSAGVPRASRAPAISSLSRTLHLSVSLCTCSDLSVTSSSPHWTRSCAAQSPPCRDSSAMALAKLRVEASNADAQADRGVLCLESRGEVEPLDADGVGGHGGREEVVVDVVSDAPQDACEKHGERHTARRAYTVRSV
ncbi:hypothetical protein FA95DRAFT_873208 [Auriscalpium vulgare]|uniref:Uncharacterized protein n=1 Tax=Auriscalpium vulgare TaxID=40419 RepID=A0ACB8S0U7_9AGAM|nr:hypothetical protein FA95DRAFT_873208 [Auriscalpium vulgare]